MDETFWPEWPWPVVVTKDGGADVICFTEAALMRSVPGLLAALVEVPEIAVARGELPSHGYDDLSDEELLIAGIDEDDDEIMKDMLMAFAVRARAAGLSAFDHAEACMRQRVAEGR